MPKILQFGQILFKNTKIRGFYGSGKVYNTGPRIESKKKSIKQKAFREKGADDKVRDRSGRA